MSVCQKEVAFALFGFLATRLSGAKKAASSKEKSRGRCGTSGQVKERRLPEPSRSGQQNQLYPLTPPVQSLCAPSPISLQPSWPCQLPHYSKLFLGQPLKAVASEGWRECMLYKREARINSQHSIVSHSIHEGSPN